MKNRIQRNARTNEAHTAQWTKSIFLFSKQENEEEKVDEKEKNEYPYTEVCRQSMKKNE